MVHGHLVEFPLLIKIFFPMFILDIIFTTVIESFIEDRRLRSVSRISFLFAVALNYLWDIGYFEATKLSNTQSFMKLVLEEPCLLAQTLPNLILAILLKLLQIIVHKKLVPEFRTISIEICSSENTFIDREMDRFLIIYIPLLLWGFLIHQFMKWRHHQ